MGSFISGELVVFPFSYTNLTNSKKWPCLIVKVFRGGDVLLCPITHSNKGSDEFIKLNPDTDFKSDQEKIRDTSQIKISNLFTADSSLMIYSIGHLKDSYFDNVKDEICKLIKK